MLLFENPSAGTTRWLRYFVFGLWAVKATAGPLSILAELPISTFRPPAPVRWLPPELQKGLLSTQGLTALQTLAVVLSVACIPQRSFRLAVWPCCFVLTIWQATLRGFSHINHAEIPLLLSAYVFAIGSLQLQRTRHFEPLAVALVLTLTYTMTGTYRIAHGGLRVFLSDSMAFWTVENSMQPGPFQWQIGPLLIHYPVYVWALQVGFFAITIIEIMAPLAIIWPNFRRLFLAAIVAFHLGVFLDMKIVFFENLLLVLMLVVVPAGTDDATNPTAPAESTG
jgi:hypothetical protein